MEKLLTLVEKIREKPEPTRWVILGVITIIMTVMLLVFWGWNLSRQFGRIAAEPEAQNEVSLLQPVSAIKKTWEALQKGEDVGLIVEESLGVKPKEEKPGIGARVRNGLAAAGQVARFNVKLMAEALRGLMQ